MALRPQNDEAFLREVDEELRRDELRSFWARWGKWLVALVVVALLALGGWLYWQNRQQQAAGLESEQLNAALDQLARNQPDAAAPALKQLAGSERPGYRAAAKLALADIAVQKGDLKAAATQYGAVAADEALGKPFRDLALIRQTAAEFDTLPPAQVVQRLTPLAQKGSAWFGSAGEMVAIAQLRLGRRAEAGKLFAAIGQDANVPPTLRSRAVQMAGILGVDAVDQQQQIGSLNK